MQIDTGPGTHRALLKLTFKQEVEVLMAPSITDICIYIYIKKLGIYLFKIVQDTYLTLTIVT